MKRPLSQCSLTQLRLRLQRGEFSASQAVGACLDRIASENGEMHAFISVRQPEALDEAAAADLGQAEDSRTRPLWGIPFAIKDLIDVGGMPTTAASRVLEGEASAAGDAECVRRTGASPRLASALAAAALRETREETGLILPDDHAALALVARAITPTNSPIRFHARFFIADADQAEGDHADSHELTELAFRPLEETRKLALMDVTEAMLEILAEDERPIPFLFTYRYGRPWRKPLG